MNTGIARSHFDARFNRSRNENCNVVARLLHAPLLRPRPPYKSRP